MYGRCVYCNQAVKFIQDCDPTVGWWCAWATFDNCTFCLFSEEHFHDSEIILKTV